MSVGLITVKYIRIKFFYLGYLSIWLKYKIYMSTKKYHKFLWMEFTSLDLNCKYFLLTKGRTQISSFLDASKNTSSSMEILSKSFWNVLDSKFIFMCSFTYNMSSPGAFQPSLEGVLYPPIKSCPLERLLSSFISEIRILDLRS